MFKMKIRKLGRFSVFVIVSVILCSMFSIQVFATGSAEFTIPDGAVASGEDFSVSLKFSADQNIGTVECNLVYDDSVIQFVDGDSASGGGGILSVRAFPESESSEISVSLKFKALKKGSSNIEISNCAILSQDGSTLGSPTAYAIITTADGGGATTTPQTPDSAATDSQSETTTTKATVATDENGVPVQGVLKSLEVSEGELIPAFSPNIYDYVVKVPNSVDYIEVEGVVAGVTDSIWYEGSKYLQVGDNVRRVSVTDENGNKKVYTITVQRQADSATEQESQVDVSQDEAETNVTTSKSNVSIVDDDNAVKDKYKNILIPALSIVMFVLILALVILIVWLRKKSKKRNENNYDDDDYDDYDDYDDDDDNN